MKNSMFFRLSEAGQPTMFQACGIDYKNSPAARRAIEGIPGIF